MGSVCEKLFEDRKPYCAIFKPDKTQPHTTVIITFRPLRSA